MRILTRRAVVMTLGSILKQCKLTETQSTYMLGLTTCRYNSQTVDDEDEKELSKKDPKALFVKEFPEYFDRGKFITRISYVDFIDQALEKLDDLGLNRNLEAYKELLRVFPKGKYHPDGPFDGIVHNEAQQGVALRLLQKLQINRLAPDAELERIVVDAFSKRSEVHNLVARGLYWTMKARNIDENPMPEVLPEEPHELAKIAIKRMLSDHKSVITTRNTSNFPNAIDETWIVSAQSPLQQSLIDRLDEKTAVYIEEGGIAYVFDKYLSYYVMKVYDDEETLKRRSVKPQPDFNFNTVKMKFYGKPIKEKLEELNDAHHVGDGHILAIGMTGTSSQDSVLSWFKLLQTRNPNLNNLNIVFRLDRSTSSELTKPDTTVSDHIKAET